MHFAIHSFRLLILQGTKHLLQKSVNKKKKHPPSIIYDKYQIASSFSPREPITLKFFAILIDSLYFMHTNVRVNSLQLRVRHVYILYIHSLQQASQPPAGFFGRQVLIEMSAFYPMQFDIGALVTIFHCHSIPVGGFHTMV